MGKRAKPAAPPQPQAVQELLGAAEEARQLRAYQTNPDVVALDVERAGRLVSRILMGGIALGFVFTTANVQKFAAGGATIADPLWWVAWLMEPMLVLIVIAILRALAVLSRHGVKTGPWTKTAVLLTGGATYFMNTWESYRTADWTGVVLHSIPPLVVVVAIEAVIEVRERLALAALQAAADNTANQHLLLAANTADLFVEPVREPGQRESTNSPTPTFTNTQTLQFANRAGEELAPDVREPLDARPADVKPTNRPAANARTSDGKRRPTVEEFTNSALEKYRPGDPVDANWVQEKAGCGKTTSYKVLDALREVLPAAAFMNAAAQPAVRQLQSANGSAARGRSQDLADYETSESENGDASSRTGREPFAEDEERAS